MKDLSLFSFFALHTNRGNGTTDGSKFTVLDTLCRKPNLVSKTLLHYTRLQLHIKVTLKHSGNINLTLGGAI